MPKLQRSLQSSDVPVFHAQTQLVLVDVLARDLKTGLPLKDLQREDFRVFDNHRDVPIATFDSGARLSLRPIALWLVVICNERGKGERGELASGWFSGRERLFRPALDDLEKNDRAGVAHWCDNGDTQLDLSPSAGHDATIAMLAKTLSPIDFEHRPSDDRRGELTLQWLLRMILDQTHRATPQPLPVLLFLHPTRPACRGTRPTCWLMNFWKPLDSLSGSKTLRPPTIQHGRFFGEQSSVLHNMASQTGGEYSSVPPDAYAATLKGILQQLHARYELGFRPPKIEGKRHKLKVDFADAAKDKSTRLLYRPEYIPAPGNVSGLR